MSEFRKSKNVNLTNHRLRTIILPSSRDILVVSLPMISHIFSIGLLILFDLIVIIVCILCHIHLQRQNISKSIISKIFPFLMAYSCSFEISDQLNKNYPLLTIIDDY